MEWNGFPLWFQFEEPPPVQVHVKDKKNAGPRQYSGSGIICKGQLQLNLSVLVRRYKIPADHPAASVHAMYWLTSFVVCHSQQWRSCCVVHMLENSVISLRTLLANLNFDMKVNGSLCVLKFIWLGSWWLEVYRMTTKHMVRLRAYVDNLSYIWLP